MGYGIRDTGYGVWDMGYGVWDKKVNAEKYLTTQIAYFISQISHPG